MTLSSQELYTDKPEKKTMMMRNTWLSPSYPPVMPAPGEVQDAELTEDRDAMPRRRLQRREGRMGSAESQG